MKNPFRYFDSSREVIRLLVMMYISFVICGWPPVCKDKVDLMF